MKKRWIAAGALLCAALVAAGPAQAATPFDAYYEDPADGFFERASGFAYTPLGELTVRPADGVRQIAAGSWLGFDVARDGAALEPAVYTVEVVEGRDIAEAYANGEIVTFGTGRVVVRVFLDDDPSVEGFGAVDVVPADGDNALFDEKANVDAAADAAFEATLTGFPDSYKPYLRALHALHPAWVFEPFDTGLDFFEAVAGESTGDRMLTLRLNFADVYKSRAAGDYDAATGEYIVKDPGWVSVNGTTISWFMDVRNQLDEQHVFQFELLRYDADVQTLAGVEAILDGTFMHEAQCDYADADGRTVAAGETYAEAILSAASESGVSPYYLAAKIRGEIGTTPTRSISGTEAGYEGIYNFYNIGASDGEGNIERGLAWAASGSSYNRPWTSPAASILGGALYLAQEYIGAGQYTGYLQKFNVNADSDAGLYSNQYMTNVSGAAGQAVSAYTGYADAGALDTAIVFSIPVYDNMPGAAARATGFLLNAAGVISNDAALRTGAAPWNAALAQLAAGDIVTVLRSVPTDAATIRAYMTYPHWYEVELSRDGETLRGYVAANFVEMAVGRVLCVGQSTVFAASLEPAGSDDVVRYLSEDTAVATVDADGVITAVAPGTATVVAYTSGGVAAKMRVAVRED
ncbi:MAG: Ig-like domain-containing protein [Oscillospiraceae bacterium]|nr:Ig-like domain-containing protein [Oscillospiraceae bacterium]